MSDREINKFINDLLFERLKRDLELNDRDRLEKIANEIDTTYLDTSNRYKLIFFAKAIAKYGLTEQIIPLLIKYICDRDAYIVDRAEIVLKELVVTLSPQLESLAIESLNSDICSLIQWSLSVIYHKKIALALPLCDRLLELSTDRDENIRKYAILILGETALECDCVIQVLINATNDSAWYIRGYALQYLRKLSHKAELILPLLIEALKDKEGHDWYVNEVALKALIELGSIAKSAIPALLDCLEEEIKEPSDDSGYACILALIVEALGNIGVATPIIIERLIAVLKLQINRPTRAAIIALGKLGAVSAIPEMLALKTAEDYEDCEFYYHWRAATIEAITKLNPPLDEQIQAFLLDAIASDDPDVLAALDKILEK